MPKCEFCSVPIKWVAQNGTVVAVNMDDGKIHQCPPGVRPQIPAKAPAAPESTKAAPAQAPHPAGEKQPEVVRHLVETHGQYQDSIEIGTRGKGVIKVYHCLDDPDGFEKKIREALRLRQFARNLQDQEVSA